MALDSLANRPVTEEEIPDNAPRITQEIIERRITEILYYGPEVTGLPTLTICSIVLDNGFSVRGESACVNVENFDAAIGKRLAYQNAFGKLWPFFGFMLAEDTHRATASARVSARSI